MDAMDRGGMFDTAANQPWFPKLKDHSRHIFRITLSLRVVGSGLFLGISLFAQLCEILDSLLQVSFEPTFHRGVKLRARHVVGKVILP